VLADISGRYPPTEWARLAITAYATHGADRIVAEVNNGGDMVEATIRMVDPNVAFTAVRASRGKQALTPEAWHREVDPENETAG
jgi:phage terminase large subunit-like protein